MLRDSNLEKVRTLAVLFVSTLYALPRCVAAAPPASEGCELHDDLVRLPGHVLPALREATLVAPTPGEETEPLTLTIILNRTDQAGFKCFLHDVYDPTSPEFRRFQSQCEMSERFGPSQEGYDGVLAWLQAQGFTVIRESANRLTVTVKGTRQQAERAFDVLIGDYRVGQRRFSANDRNPALPAEIASRVQAIAGLSDLPKAEGTRSALAEVFAIAICTIPFSIGYASEAYQGTVIPDYPKALGKCINGIKQMLISGYFSGAIDPPAPTWKGLDGTGQKIGIIAWDSFNRQDVADYLALIGAPATQIDKLSEFKVNGGAPPGSEQGEVLLDIAAVMSIAPGADVVVYDAPFAGPNVTFQALLNAAINDGATIITNSFAYCEDQTSAADVQSIDAILASAAAAGITVVTGSGDRGSTCLDGSADTVHVPAGSPNITAVGASSVVNGPDFAWQSETPWGSSGDTPPSGEGGFGTSRFFSRPSYQDGKVASSMRSIPDLVTNGDPRNGIMICQASAGGCPNGLLYGGTSLAAPLWAGFTAILNQSRGTNLGLLNPQLYALADSPGAFHAAAELGSDFAHVGLGSPHLDTLHSLLTGQNPGPVSASDSQVRAVVSSKDTFAGTGSKRTGASADGNAEVFVTVRLADSNGLYLFGQTVSLSASAGSAVITPSSMVIPSDSRTAIFHVTDVTPETFELTATDVTDGVVLNQKASITFVTPPAASGGIFAAPDTVAADGSSTATIIVSLQDAKGNPTPDKLVSFSQGNGHSILTGPDPARTDSNGQIQFTATDTVGETVTYTAVDVTDGDLPIPGSATVTFSGGGVACLTPPTPADGFTITSFANGFLAKSFFFGNINFSGCPGASNPAFDTSGNVYVVEFPTGKLFKFSTAGGAVSSANLLSTLGQTFGNLVIGKDGNLYGTHYSPSDIVQVDGTTGQVVRTLASGYLCPNGLAVDPLSGDLFFDDGCTGAGYDNPSVWRISDPAGANPTVSVYATLPSTPGGGIAFAPNGTMYVVADAYTETHQPIVQISGTDQPSPPTATTIMGITSNNGGVAIGASLPNGAAQSLIVHSVIDADPSAAGILQLIDITTTPFTFTALATGTISPGVIGPDGCMYPNASDTILKLAPSSGGCGFSPTNPSPAISLDAAVPSSPQGSFTTLTATLHNVSQPEGLAITFNAGGVNPEMKLVRADSNGQAIFDHLGTFTGDDSVVATTNIGGNPIISNKASVSWSSATHVTFLTLNPSPTIGTVGQAVTLKASLTDISVVPALPLPSASVAFTLGDLNCTGVTDPTGIASCDVTLDQEGLLTLTAGFLPESTQYASAGDQTSFTAVAAVTEEPPCSGCGCGLCGNAGIASLSMLFTGLCLMKLKLGQRRALPRPGERRLPDASDRG